MADIDEDVYKLLFMDVGIAAYLAGMDWIALQALDGQALMNEVKLAEQFVGQHLMTPLESPSLTHWLREVKSVNAEADFVTSSGNWVVPVEVKAGKSGALKSWQQFARIKNPSLCVRFDVDHGIDPLGGGLHRCHGRLDRGLVLHFQGQGSNAGDFDAIRLPAGAEDTMAASGKLFRRGASNARRGPHDKHYLSI